MRATGPRPALWNQDLLTAERDKYGANNVKPGLTGLAQINGRDELEIPDKAKLDKNLPGVRIPDNIVFTSDFEQAVINADVIIIATPSVFVRSTAEKLKPIIKNHQIVVCVSKGIEQETLYTMSEVIKDVLGEKIQSLFFQGQLMPKR